MSVNNKVIKIDSSCLEDHQIEKDMESSFNYLNHHFFVFAIGMIIIF